MNRRIRLVGIGVVVVLASASVALVAREPNAFAPLDGAELDKLVGQPVDLAPWAYVWRADLAVQEQPEAYFIPRRLERLDKVYRTAHAALPPQELKSIYYEMPDLLQPLPAPPEGRLPPLL